MPQIIDTPLTPTRLVSLKCWDERPSLEGWQAASKNGRTYTLFAHHGYVGDDRVAGLVTLHRKPGGGGPGDFVLEVLQRRLSLGNREHVLEAEIHCRTDALGTPLSWNLESRFYDKGSGEDRRLRQTMEGRTEDKRLELTVNGRHESHRFGPGLSAEWPLMVALTHRPDLPAPGVQFDFFQEFNLLKRRHTLRFREGVHDDLDGIAPLTCTLQTGPGVLPMEYWFTEEGVLACMIRSYDAWLLDERAQVRYDEKLKALSTR
jgi:hypothetical protein